MSFKSKDLHYEKQEPAFLRRLKGAYDANDGRSNVQIARPKKDRLKTGDGDDDEPLILDENGEVVGRKEFDGMVKGLDRGESKGGNGDGEVTANEPSVADKKREEKQQVAGIGTGRKRKQAKAVGGGSGDDEEEEPSVRKLTDKPTVESNQHGKTDRHEKQSTTTAKSNEDKPKKKAKKVKLSFDEP